MRFELGREAAATLMIFIGFSTFRLLDKFKKYGSRVSQAQRADVNVSKWIRMLTTLQVRMRSNGSGGAFVAS